MMSSLRTTVLTAALVLWELARLSDTDAGVAKPTARTGINGPNSFCPTQALNQMESEA